MPTPSAQHTRRETAPGRVDFDTIVIGAGISGLYQLYRLREIGQKVRVFEAGTGVGGTWYWNRYPGCRFDSESYSYGFSFSQELLDEWDWTEHFAPQPETERYLNHVADKFDLRRDIQFRSRVTAATWDEARQAWDIALEDGAHHSSRYLVSAVGPLSAPTLPRTPGVQDFQGLKYAPELLPWGRILGLGRRGLTFAGRWAHGALTPRQRHGHRRRSRRRIRLGRRSQPRDRTHRDGPQRVDPGDHRPRSPGNQVHARRRNNPFMKEGFGIAAKDLGTQIGPKAFASRRQLIDTLVHEELHHRWWKRGLYNHHANPALDALFEATVQRYMKLRGF